ncbi:hypothetical protein NE865_00123 [Phthorimaea operculella]|nr:hypothetical protein NE865_00123 [Phthorimaea operculella]
MSVYLHVHSFNREVKTSMLVTGTFVGYLIIFAGAAAGYVLQHPSHKRIDIFYSLIGCALFVASGAVLIKDFQGKSDEWSKKQLAKASLAIINGAVLLLDAVFTQRGG